MRRVLALVLSPVLAAALWLILAPGASASTCASLQGDLDAATDGQVVTAPAGICPVNLNIANTHSFTLEGDPSGSMLEPLAPGTPIIISNADVRYTVSGITFTGMNGQSAVQIDGAAEAVTFSGDTFTNNVGGALDIVGSGGTPQPTVIKDSVFSGNQGSAEGAVFIGADPAILVDGNTFTNNSGRDGGGLSISNGAGEGTLPITVTNNTFGGPTLADGNSATEAGGGASVTGSHGQLVTISGNTFESNQIAGELGGATSDRLGAGLAVAIHGDDSAFSAVQSGNRFIGNTISEPAATGHPGLDAGGAGEWVVGVSVSSTDDVFDGNVISVSDGAPPQGGGLGVFGTNEVGPQPGRFTGANDLFVGNSVASGGRGGAIYVGGPDYDCSSACPASSLALSNSTLYKNRATSGEGGALWGSSNDSLVVTNSILAVNGAGPAQPDVFGFSGPSVQFSDACGPPTLGGPLPGAGNICNVPALALDGTELANSPTVDAGSNALPAAGLAVDLAGNPRILPGHLVCGFPDAAVVDMGAFEAPTPTSGGGCPAGKLTVGKPRRSKKGITITLTCAGSRGEPCQGYGVLLVTEHHRGHKILRLSRTRVKTKSVDLGERDYSLHAGGKVKVPLALNKAGRSLLKRFHKVPLRVRIIQSADGAQTTVSTKRLTVKPLRKHHKKKR